MKKINEIIFNALIRPTWPGGIKVTFPIRLKCGGLGKVEIELSELTYLIDRKVKKAFKNKSCQDCRKRK